MHLWSSLYRIHTHTHTLIKTLTHTLKHTHTNTHVLSHPDTHTYFETHTHTQTHTFFLIQTLTHTLKHTHAHTHTHRHLRKKIASLSIVTLHSWIHLNVTKEIFSSRKNATSRFLTRWLTICLFCVSVCECVCVRERERERVCVFSFLMNFSCHNVFLLSKQEQRVTNFVLSIFETI